MKYEKYKNELGFKNKLARFVWNTAWLFLFRPINLPQLNNWRIFLLKLFGAKIGSGCKIQSTVKVWAPWNLEIGNLVAMGFDVLIYNPGKISIGSKVAISQRVHLCSASHNFTLKENPLITAPIEIGDRAWIAADAFVGPGVCIGKGSVVGARAAVFKNINSWIVVGGNPAREIKKRQLINE